MREMAGWPPKSIMNKRQLVSTFLVSVLWVVSSCPIGWAGEMVQTPSFSITSRDDQLHALNITLPHLMTLQKFHSGLFTPTSEVLTINQMDAMTLNAGLNAFLSSRDREELLLQALRANKAVMLRFKIPQKTGQTELLTHPTKPLLYRLEPEVKEIPVSIQIHPLLDGPLAFRITLEEGAKVLMCEVDWLGQIVSRG